jgi:hypothetical protein
VSTKPTLLRALVTERHLQRYDSFLAWFTRAAKALADREGEPALASATIGRRQYERWLSGIIAGQPYPDACRVLEHMFGYTVDELFGPPEQNRGESVTDAPAGVPALADPGAAAADDRHSLVLRSLGGDTTPVLTPGVLEVIDTVRRNMNATLADEVDLNLLDEWEWRVDDYTRAYQVTPPLNLLGDVLLDFTDVQSALRDGQFRGQQVQLWRLSARLAGLVGVIFTMLGAHRDARAWLHTGGRAASVSDDAHMRAWMYTRAAIVSLHFRTPASALALADKAAALHRVPSGAAVRTQLVRARALARLGKRASAWHALEQARVAFESLDGHETSNKVFGHTERQFLAHSANTLTTLRDTRAAAQLREEALAAFAGHDAAEQLDPALVRIDEGLCLLWESDPTTACRHVIDAIWALPRGHRTGLVQVSAHAILVALTPAQHRLRAVTDLQESLRSAFAAPEPPSEPTQAPWRTPIAGTP